MHAIPTNSPVNVAALDEADPNAGGACHLYGIQFGIAAAAEEGESITLNPLEVRAISPRHRVTWQEVDVERLAKATCTEVALPGSRLPTWHEARALVPGCPVSAARAESGAVRITWLPREP